MINLLLIDSQSTFIKGIKTTFEQDESEIKIVGSKDSCKEALGFLENNLVHVILLDPDLLNKNCISKIKSSFPDIKIISLTNELDINYLNNLWNSGVDGIELKNCGKKALLQIIANVLDGKRVQGKKIPDFLNESLHFNKKDEPKLSIKEKAIYALMCSGMSCEEISKKLLLPIFTVRFHCKNILKKFNKSSLTAFAKEYHIDKMAV